MDRRFYEFLAFKLPIRFFRCEWLKSLNIKKQEEEASNEFNYDDDDTFNAYWITQLLERGVNPSEGDSKWITGIKLE